MKLKFPGGFVHRLCTIVIRFIANKWNKTLQVDLDSSLNCYANRCNRWFKKFNLLYITCGIGCSITGFYRSNCSTPCPDVSCQYCHIETGTCQGCKPGYQGHRCEIGTYVWNILLIIFFLLWKFHRNFSSNQKRLYLVK